MAYGKNRMSQAKKRSNGGPGDGKKKMTRKQAKEAKRTGKEQGHPVGKMSVRKIRKYGTYSKF